MYNLLKNDNVAVAVFRGEEAVILRGHGRIVNGEGFVKRTWDHIHKYQLQVDESGRDALGYRLSTIKCAVSWK